MSGIWAGTHRFLWDSHVLRGLTNTVGVQEVYFEGISEQCLGANYRISYRTASDPDWKLLEDPSGSGVVSATTVVANIADLAGQDIRDFAISLSN